MRSSFVVHQRDHLACRHVVFSISWVDCYLGRRVTVFAPTPALARQDMPAISLVDCAPNRRLMNLCLVSNFLRGRETAPLLVRVHMAKTDRQRGLFLAV